MEQYYYEYEQDSIYCYPDSFILKNKLNIRDQETLEEAERNITALRILELKQKPPRGKLTFKYLQKLHKQIFGDIYDWAGYEVDFSEVSAQEMVEASAEAFLKEYGKMNELMRRIVKRDH